MASQPGRRFYQPLRAPGRVWLLDGTLMDAWFAADPGTNHQMAEHTHEQVSRKTWAQECPPMVRELAGELAAGVIASRSLDDLDKQLFAQQGVIFGVHAAAIEAERGWIIKNRVHPAVALAIDRFPESGLPDADEPLLLAAQVGYWAARTKERPWTIFERLALAL